jgi:hypothetical protein
LQLTRGQRSWASRGKTDVWRAADELAAGAQKVTFATMRKALGGGSFSTIS